MVCDYDDARIVWHAVEAECDCRIAWARENGPVIAKDFGLPQATVMRVLAKALDRQIIILGETMLADAAEPELGPASTSGPNACGGMRGFEKQAAQSAGGPKRGTG